MAPHASVSSKPARATRIPTCRGDAVATDAMRDNDHVPALWEAGEWSAPASPVGMRAAKPVQMSGVFGEGVSVAVSLTFDDARASQLEGVRILDDHGLRATFYVLPSGVAAAPDRWWSVARLGHEIGNHSSTHPCSANFDFAAANALEDHTMQDIADDVDAATAMIQELIGVRPRTFAYPCGQSFTGRGRYRQSYVPIIAERFVAGRGCGSEVGNLPESCDLAHLEGYTVDGLDAGELRSLVAAGMTRGEWVIMAGHDIGADGPQTVSAPELDRFCSSLIRDDRVWVAPVVEVAERVAGVTQSAVVDALSGSPPRRRRSHLGSRDLRPAPGGQPDRRPFQHHEHPPSSRRPGAS